MPDSPHDSSLDRLLDQLVEGYRILDMEGHTDMAQGFVGMRDPAGRGFWLKKTGIGLGEVGAPDDLILVDFDGNRREGAGGLLGEWPIVSEILWRRPDAMAVGHTHPFHICVFAAATAPFQAVAHEGSVIKGPIGRFTHTSNLILTKEVGQILADDLGEAQAVLMVNHGATYIGRSVPECVLAGIWLEKACSSLLAVQAAGLDWTAPDQRDLDRKYETVMGTGYVDRSWEFYRRKLARHSGGRS
ncbi:MAG: class II aldolase/adducin family protein [Rhodospirillaceae bacterium]|nr:class II aldolase/adducin family protein [Rhodospirillaceae bacterium]